MSLWFTRPSEESLELPKHAPTDADRTPRLLRSVLTTQFVDIACGGGHCMAVSHDGRLYAWGWNAHGQCGLGADAGAVVPSPRAIGRLVGRTVAAVACGSAHTVALVEAPDVEDHPGCVVYAWGAQHAGQLGHGPTSKVHEFHSPSEVVELRGIAGRLSRDGDVRGIVNAEGQLIAQPLGCGLGHTALVSHDNVLWTWGANQYGQCGQQKVEGESIAPPGQVFALAAQGGVVGVACGGCHTLAITSPGVVYSFGLNATGQLGDGSHHSKPSPTPAPVRLPPSMAVSWVACGEEFSAAVSRGGQLFMWGFGGCGQLGLGTSGSMRVPRQVACAPIEEVACGSGHVIARTTRDGLLTWGYIGTWDQCKAYAQAQEAGREGSGSAEHATGGVHFAEDGALVQNVAIGVAPVLLPLPVDLNATGDIDDVSIEGGGVSRSGGSVPGTCGHVAAGRHCAVFLGDLVQPIPDSEAALMIQCTFRRDKARKQTVQKRKQEHAAAVIGGRASDYLARRALDSSLMQKQAAEREAAATRMQAHQRRRMEAAKVEEKKAEVAHRNKPVVWATNKSAKGVGANALPLPKPHLVPKSPPKRTGGGFTRKR